MTELYNTMLGLNIQSLRYNKDYFSTFLETLMSQPDAAVLTETWTTEDDDHDQYSLNGYQLIE